MFGYIQVLYMDFNSRFFPSFSVRINNEGIKERMFFVGSHNFSYLTHLSIVLPILDNNLKNNKNFQLCENLRRCCLTPWKLWMAWWNIELLQQVQKSCWDFYSLNLVWVRILQLRFSLHQEDSTIFSCQLLRIFSFWMSWQEDKK